MGGKQSLILFLPSNQFFLKIALYAGAFGGALLAIAGLAAFLFGKQTVEQNYPAAIKIYLVLLGSAFFLILMCIPPLFIRTFLSKFFEMQHALHGDHLPSWVQTIQRYAVPDFLTVACWLIWIVGLGIAVFGPTSHGSQKTSHPTVNSSSDEL